MVIMVLILFLMLLLYDSLTMLKTVGKKIKAVYYTAMGIAFAVMVLKTLDVSVPSPSYAIEKALDALFHIGG